MIPLPACLVNEIVLFYLPFHEIWQLREQLQPLNNAQFPKRLEQYAANTLEHALETVFGDDLWCNTVKPSLIETQGIISGSWPFQVLTNQSFQASDIDVFVCVNDIDLAQPDFLTPFELQLVSCGHFASSYRQRRIPPNSPYCQLPGDKIGSVRDFCMRNNTSIKLQVIQVNGRQHPARTNHVALLGWVNEFDFDFCKCAYIAMTNRTYVSLPFQRLPEMMDNRCELRVVPQFAATMLRFKKYLQRNVTFYYRPQAMYKEFIALLQRKHIRVLPTPLIVEVENLRVNDESIHFQPRYALTNANALALRDDQPVEVVIPKISIRPSDWYIFFLNVVWHVGYLMCDGVMTRFAIRDLMSVSNDTIKWHPNLYRRCVEASCFYGIIGKQHVHFTTTSYVDGILIEPSNSEYETKSSQSTEEQKDNKPQRTV